MLLLSGRYPAKPVLLVSILDEYIEIYKKREPSEIETSALADPLGRCLN